MNHQPLSMPHLVVLDLTHMLSGPYGTMLLADLGATVIKVEPPGGEMTRQLLANDPKNSRDGMGAYFLTLNRNKKSIVVNLKTPSGLAVFYELVKHADVVVNNFSPGVPKRLGIDREKLASYNPRIITCSITGFGETGPLATRPAFDQVAQAMGGGMSITGQPDGPPVRAGIPIGDLGGGIFAVVGILAALQARNTTGEGQHIDISMLDVQISLLNYMATMHLLSGEIPKPLGNGHFVHVPYNTFQTRDSWLVVAVVNDHEWTNLVAALGADDLRDQRFLARSGRWESRDFINNRIGDILRTDNTEAWQKLLSANNVPCAPVNDFAHALDNEQIVARDMIVETTLPTGERVRMPGNPVKLSGAPTTHFTAPPKIGGDTENVLGEMLGKTPAEISALRDAGAVA